MSGIITIPGVSDLEPGFHELAAMSVSLDGYTVRQDYTSIVKNYSREEMILWHLIPKQLAGSDPVQDLQEGPEPQAGFLSKIDLNPIENPSDLPAHTFPTGPGQAIKAVGGIIKFGHYARSLYQQQGRPFGDITARKSERLIIRTCKEVERALFVGSAVNNPLEFNGIIHQMPPSHRYTCDVTQGDSVVKKLRGLVRLAVNDEFMVRTPTHIFCSGLGVELLEEEVDAKLEYHNLESVRPGLRVPAIVTQAGILPIVPSPWIRDTDGGTEPDTVHFFVIDINSLSWHGVYPEGGTRTFDPQIFDVSTYTTSAAPYLLEKRMCLMYGTLKAENNGEGLYMLSARVPSGRVGGI